MTGMRVIRTAYHRALLMPGVGALSWLARRNCATVFMCHRFTDRERGIQGIEPACLRRALEYLRKQDYELLSLGELCMRLRNDQVPGGAVVFTIDDGYIDHALVAAPVFAEFDCPVTTFLTTGFLDGSLWMWWDKIEYVFSNAVRRVIDISIGSETRNYDCEAQDDRVRAAADLVERCKPLAHDRKLSTIARLAELADVQVPDRPPEACRPMSWDDARRCEKGGMTFGPHTVTHPILTSVPPERSAWEITESWRRLTGEVSQPVPIFSYPNGGWTDFGDNEVRVLREAAFLGAVASEWGFADRASFQEVPDGPFKTKRLPFPESLSDLVQYVSGIERCKELLRSKL